MASATNLTEESIHSQWTEFKTKHNKAYPDEETEAKKKEVFIDNLKGIADHNERFKNGQETYQKGVNQFSDLTPEEWKNRNHGLGAQKI